MHADELLAGPRGRRLCFELLGFPTFGLRGIPPAQVAEHVAQTVEELTEDDAAAGPRIFRALRESVAAAMYWQEPDSCDAELAEPRWAEALRPVADAVAGSSATAWWSTAAELSDQHYDVLLEWREASETPALTGAGQALSTWRAGVDAQNSSMRRFRTGTTYVAPDGQTGVSGAWWSAPIQLPIRATTRAIDRFGPVGLWLIEDELGLERAETWPVRSAGTPRIFEITGADAWVELVRRQPLDATDARGPDWQRATGRLGGWLIPDWQAVADEYDGVHLSVLGYLSAAGRSIPVGPDAATVIAGWAPDETYWLRDVLEIAGPATEWSRDDDGDWRPILS